MNTSPPWSPSTSSANASLLSIQRLQSAIVQTAQDDLAKYGTRAQQDLLGQAL